MNIQGSFPLGLTSWISLQFKGFSRVFYSTTVWRHQFFSTQPFFIIQLSHPYMTTGKTIALTIQNFVGKVMSLLFNKLSRFVIAFLLRREHLLLWFSEESKWEVEMRDCLESNLLYTRNECDLNYYCGIGDKREEAKVGRDTNGVHFTRPGAPLMKRVKERERVIRDSQNSGISTSLRRRILKDKLTCCGDQNVVFKKLILISWYLISIRFLLVT